MLIISTKLFPVRLMLLIGWFVLLVTECKSQYNSQPSKDNFNYRSSSSKVSRKRSNKQPAALANIDNSTSLDPYKDSYLFKRQIIILLVPNAYGGLNNQFLRPGVIPYGGLVGGGLPGGLPGGVIGGLPGGILPGINPGIPGFNPGFNPGLNQGLYPGGGVPINPGYFGAAPPGVLRTAGSSISSGAGASAASGGGPLIGGHGGGGGHRGFRKPANFQV